MKSTTEKKKLDSAMEAAIRRSPGKRSGHYGAELAKTVEAAALEAHPRLSDYGELAKIGVKSRVVDKSLQRLRRAGKIYYASSGWHAYAPGSMTT
jgi:hypothetical protein